MTASASELTVGDVLRLCRAARGCSARALSLRAGLSESVVGKIEAGNMQPSLQVFASIVHVLELSPREVAFLVALARRPGPITDGTESINRT